MNVGKIETIETREDFTSFVHDLRNDLLEGAAYWQNTSLDSYLDSAEFWVSERMDEYFRRYQEQVPPQPSWRLFAEILFAAAVYE